MSRSTHHTGLRTQGGEGSAALASQPPKSVKGSQFVKARINGPALDRESLGAYVPSLEVRPEWDHQGSWRLLVPHARATPSLGLARLKPSATPTEAGKPAGRPGSRSVRGRGGCWRRLGEFTARERPGGMDDGASTTSTRTATSTSTAVAELVVPVPLEPGRQAGTRAPAHLLSRRPPTCLRTLRARPFGRTAVHPGSTTSCAAAAPAAAAVEQA